MNADYDESDEEFSGAESEDEVQADKIKRSVEIGPTQSIVEAAAWDGAMGVRELCQNWYDALLASCNLSAKRRELRIDSSVSKKGVAVFAASTADRRGVGAIALDRGKKTLTLLNANASIAPSSFRLGRSAGKGANQIGKYGEGLNMGIGTLLVCHNHRCEVIYDTGGRRRKFHFQNPKYEDPAPVLFIKQTRLGPKSQFQKDTKVTINNFDASFFVPENFLWLKPPVLDQTITTPHGTILLAPEYKQKMFNRGIFVAKIEDLSFGYDFEKKLETSRDRNYYNTKEVLTEVSLMLEFACSRPEYNSLLCQLYELLETESAPRRFEIQRIHKMPLLVERITNQFFERHGEKAFPVGLDDEKTCTYVRAVFLMDPIRCSKSLIRVLHASTRIKTVEQEENYRFDQILAKKAPYEKDLKAVFEVVAPSPVLLTSKLHGGTFYLNASFFKKGDIFLSNDSLLAAAKLFFEAVQKQYNLDLVKNDLQIFRSLMYGDKSDRVGNIIEESDGDDGVIVKWDDMIESVSGTPMTYKIILLQLDKNSETPVKSIFYTETAMLGLPPSTFIDSSHRYYIKVKVNNPHKAYSRWKLLKPFITIRNQKLRASRAAASEQLETLSKSTAQGVVVPVEPQPVSTLKEQQQLAPSAEADAIIRIQAETAILTSVQPQIAPSLIAPAIETQITSALSGNVETPTKKAAVMQEIGIQTDKERASSPAESMFSMLDSEFINLLSTVDDEHIEEEPGDFEEAILADIDLESFNPIRSKSVSSKRPRFITKSLHFLDLYEVNPNEYPEKSFSFLSNSQEISVGDFIVLERDSKTIILKFLSHIQSEEDDDGGFNRHDEAENGFLVVQIYQPIGQVPLLSQVDIGDRKGEVVLMNRQTPSYILPSELSNGFQNCAVMVKDARDDKCTADGVDFFFARFGYSSGCGDANGFSLEALKQIPKNTTCTCNICDGLKRREPVNVSVAELSAGCGGFALGAVISTAVENVNFVSKWCCEEDADSVQACSQNNGVVFQEATGKLIERIRSGTLNMSGTADILAVNGSTECGDLVLSSVDTLHPTLVVLHSSPQILSPTGSQEIFSLMVNLVKKGYGVRWQVLDSCKYSVPLSQKYFVMFASAPGHSCPQFPMPVLEPTPTLREALDGLPPPSDSDFPFNAIEKTSRYARFLNQFVGQSEFTFNHVSCRLENKGSLSTLKWDEKVENLDTTRSNKLKWMHPDSERLFSVRELCRLVSFPDDFRLWGTVESQRMQVSKSFPPLLAKAIFEGVGAWILKMKN